ncbi:MAG: hypothetical protein P8X82_19055, partial [Gemmatimonadales bacterium]
VALRFVALRFVALRLAAILLLLVKVIPAKADGLLLNGDRRRSITTSLRCSQTHPVVGQLRRFATLPPRRM